MIFERVLEIIVRVGGRLLRILLRFLVLFYGVILVEINMIFMLLCFCIVLLLLVVEYWILDIGWWCDGIVCSFVFFISGIVWVCLIWCMEMFVWSLWNDIMLFIGWLYFRVFLDDNCCVVFNVFFVMYICDDVIVIVIVIFLFIVWFL